MKVAVFGCPCALDRAEELLFRTLPLATTELLCSGETEQVVTRVAHTLRIPLRSVSDHAAVTADEVLIFWDGNAGGGSRLAAACVKRGQPVRLLPIAENTV